MVGAIVHTGSATTTTHTAGASLRRQYNRTSRRVSVLPHTIGPSTWTDPTELENDGWALFDWSNPWLPVVRRRLRARRGGGLFFWLRRGIRVVQDRTKNSASHQSAFDVVKSTSCQRKRILL